jgi:hypothetical protein
VPVLGSLLSRGGSPKTDEATSAARPTKRPVAKAGAAAGTKTASAKAGAAPAKKAGTATKAERNGGGRPNTKGARTSSRTSNAPGTSSGRVTSTDKPAKKVASSESTESTERPATLQPRARKNKKR